MVMVIKTYIPNLIELLKFLCSQFAIDFVQGLILASCQVPKISQICENVSFNKVFLSLDVYCLES